MNCISKSLLCLMLLSLTLIAETKKDLPFQPLPKKIPAPLNNPTTPDKVHLGAQLFSDPRLSKDCTVSCASCHNVSLSGGDNRATSVGVNGQKGGRSAPTVWNAALHSVQFWDGRAHLLEDQAKGPLTNPIEMAMPDHASVVERIKQIPGYVALFKKAFDGNDSVTIDNVAKAIASYERTLVTPSPFDAYLENKGKISAQATRGLQTVVSVGCTTCHNGVNFNGAYTQNAEEVAYQKFPMFTENEFVAKYDLSSDLGRFQVTKDEDDKNKWRVPTWRNVELTAPYFHNGRVETLEEAVRVMGKSQLNIDLKPEQISDIVAFLKTLTGKQPKMQAPELPPTSGKSFCSN